MKLYTEEDLLKAIAFGFGVCHKEDRAPFNTEMREFINSLTPIELLSDDDVYKNYKTKTEIMIGHGFHGTLLSQEEFINRIKTDNEFAKTWGDLGYTNDIEKK